jgi:hypothetical protein
VNAHHDDDARKTKNGEMLPFLAHQMSKWFYDTSTGAATGAVPLWFFCWRGSDRRGVGCTVALLQPCSLLCPHVL